jgi:hypothetical protein
VEAIQAVLLTLDTTHTINRYLQSEILLVAP